MIQLPEKPWNEGDTFTNDTTGVEYTFDGVKWLASGGEELDLSGFVTDAQLVAVEDASVMRDEVLDGKIEQESNLNTVAHLKLEDQIQWTNTHWQQGDAKLQDQIDAIEFPEADLSDYVKQSDSWDMSLGTSLGVNVLKPLDGGTPYVYYEPRDYNSTHPCGIVNRGLMQTYVQEEIAKASGTPELPKFKLVASDPRDWGNGSFVVLDSSGVDTRSLDSTRAIFISAFDVDGKRWARDRDGIEYGRIFSGHINALLQNGDKTIFTMSPHYNAKCQMAYFPGNEESPHAGYLIAWQGVLSHTVTSDTSVWNVGAFYRFSIPEIFF